MTTKTNYPLAHPLHALSSETIAAAAEARAEAIVWPSTQDHGTLALAHEYKRLKKELCDVMDERNNIGLALGMIPGDDPRDILETAKKLLARNEERTETSNPDNFAALSRVLKSELEEGTEPMNTDKEETPSTSTVRTIDVVFDGPPSHESGRFIEVEDSDGHSIKVGEWIHRADDYWALRIPLPHQGAEMTASEEETTTPEPGHYTMAKLTTTITAGDTVVAQSDSHDLWRSNLSAMSNEASSLDAPDSPPSAPGTFFFPPELLKYLDDDSIHSIGADLFEHDVISRDPDHMSYDDTRHVLSKLRVEEA